MKKNKNDKWRKGDVYDFMLFFNPYIEIYLQEIKTFRKKHKIIDVPYYAPYVNSRLLKNTKTYRPMRF
jgi:hypothetical protein